MICCLQPFLSLLELIALKSRLGVGMGPLVLSCAPESCLIKRDLSAGDP